MVLSAETGELRLFPAQAAEALLPNRGAASANDDRSAGIAAGRDAALDDMVDLRESFAGHADGRRGLHWKAAAARDGKRERVDQQRQH